MKENFGVKLGIGLFLGATIFFAMIAVASLLFTGFMSGPSEAIPNAITRVLSLVATLLSIYNLYIYGELHKLRRKAYTMAVISSVLLLIYIASFILLQGFSWSESKTFIVIALVSVLADILLFFNRKLFTAI